MADCPDCEYHRQRAQRWREEAYKLSGHPLPEREWVGLTDLADVTWQMVLSLPPRFQPVGVPLPSPASRLLPFSKPGLGQKLLGR